MCLKVLTMDKSTLHKRMNQLFKLEFSQQGMGGSGKLPGEHSGILHIRTTVTSSTLQIYRPTATLKTTSILHNCCDTCCTAFKYVEPTIQLSQQPKISFILHSVMQDQVWPTWMKLNKHTQNNNNKSMNRLRYLHLLLRSTQKKLWHICNSLRSHAWSKHRVRQSSIHAGNAPVLNLPDHGEIPNSFGTRRGRAGDSAERGGRERKGVQTKSLNRVRQGTVQSQRSGASKASTTQWQAFQRM